MDETPGCWTNQQSIIEFKNQWYLFYHNCDLSPHFDKNRTVCIDSMFFNEDGTIRKVIPTLRGVGLMDASQKIQIDRCNLKSDRGASIDFIDTLHRFEGRKTLLASENAWIQYNGVDFGSTKFTSVEVRAASNTGGTVQVRLDKVEGPILARIEIPQRTEWSILHSSLKDFSPGIHNLIILLEANDNVNIDWLRFQ